MAFTTRIPELIERNNNGLLGMHPSWERVRLGDALTVQNGAAFKSEYFNTEGRGMPLLRIRDIVPGATETWYDGPYDDEYVVQPGDLIIGMDGDFNHALWAGPPALLNQRVCRLTFRTDAVRKEWALHALGGYLQAVNDATPSVTVKHLSSRTVADLLLPLPPLREQDRIVDAISRHLQRVADGLGSFRRLEALSDAYVAALYSASFRGELVGGSELDDSTGFPSHWKVETLGELAERVTSGSRDWKPYYGRGSGVFVLTQNVRPRALDVSNPFHVDPPVTDPAVERSAIRLDDLLVTIVGANVGNAARVPLELSEHYVCQSLALIRLKESGLSRFLELYLTSPAGGQRYFETCFYGQGRPHLSFVDLKKMRVPIAPPAERDAIVAAFDRQFDAALGAKATALRARTDAAVLTTGILRAAVEGELVERRPEDGRSSDLLARIRTAAKPGSARKKRRAVLAGE